MAKEDLLHYYAKARKEKWAFAQFNFSSTEQLQGIVEAGMETRSPLLVGTSEGDISFLSPAQAVNLVAFWRKETGLPIFLNFDHGKSFEVLERAAEAGYDVLHFDGSKFSIEENIHIAKQVVAFARKHGISVVEGEFSEVPGGHSDLHNQDAPVLTEQDYTDAAAAQDFVKKSGVDSLAVMVGTLHGIFKTTQPLNIRRLQEIASRGIEFLVLHGGSGTPEQELKEAILSGVVKINVSTDLRIAFTSALKETMQNNPEEIAPYHLLPKSVAAVKEVAQKWIGITGSANKI
ncbi:MAG: ketose-bisphosphate aldolase [Candidatus Wildermuthbacteria bacterium]|nr:ketose-bisphosphate aldolase [Candidatus Wildermuthbacteria bacterium]